MREIKGRVLVDEGVSNKHKVYANTLGDQICLRRACFWGSGKGRIEIVFVLENITNLLICLIGNVGLVRNIY